MAAPEQMQSPSPDSRSAPSLTTPSPMQCMEIFGGNEPVDQAFRLSGMDAWVKASIYGEDDAGGDIHYVSMCAGGKICRFALADVAGHGLEASDLATKLRREMRRNINTLDQKKFARAVNSAFEKHSGGDGRFATAVLTTYFQPTNQLIVCNAGHPMPAWYRARDKGWIALEPGQAESDSSVQRNFPFGVIEPTQFEQYAVRLDKGDRVLLYTDGLIEAADENGELLGEAGLYSMLNELGVMPPSDFLKELNRRIVERVPEGKLDDDLTMVLLDHTAVPAPRPSLKEFARTLGKMVGLVEV